MEGRAGLTRSWRGGLLRHPPPPWIDEVLDAGWPCSVWQLESPAARLPSESGRAFLLTMARRSRSAQKSASGSALAAPIPVALVHLGCARNLIDSELILARMAERGLAITGDTEQAEVVVVNTCSFIGEAREESRAAIEAQLEAKRRGDLRAVVVAGCLVERYRRGLVREFPEVDLFSEISDYRELAGRVSRLASGQRVPAYLEAGLRRAEEREGARLLATPGSYAYLRISHGCDHQCSFCAIPVMRGKHRSKTAEAVLGEGRELLDAGVRELVLVAEDSTAWGRDFDSELPDLVEALAEIDGDHMVRVMYAYPNRFPWRLAELLDQHPRVARYLDMPVQHASTNMLRAMRRHGSGEQMRGIVDRLLEEVPGLTLRTTLLMGFPGETDADAEEAVRFVESARIARVGAFGYSPEEGTPGHELDGRIEPELIRARLEAVFAARDRVLFAEQEGRIGETLDVLVDEVHPHAPPGRPAWVGRDEREAPEVDLLVLPDPRSPESQPGAEGRAGLTPPQAPEGLQVADRIQARVTGVDGEGNLLVVEASEQDCAPSQ